MKVTSKCPGERKWKCKGADNCVPCPLCGKRHGHNPLKRKVSMKYQETQGVGKSKYVVVFHDGKKLHPDGSEFYDVRIFSNKRKKQTFINQLEEKGYTTATS